MPDNDVLARAASLISLRPQPLIVKIVDGMSAVTMVSSKFGEVPKGSLLSYQCPAVLPKVVVTHPNAPQFPHYLSHNTVSSLAAGLNLHM